MNELIAIRADGAMAEGRFLCRSAYAIEVEIVFPYTGFSTSLELLSFGRGTEPEGLLGDEGLRSGQYLLRTLYKICQYLDENDEALAEGYREYRQLHHELVDGGDKIGDHFLAMVSEDLRDRLTEGAIDREQYDRELSSFRVAHSRYHERLYHLRTEFFRMHFAQVDGRRAQPVLESSLGRGLEQQVLDYLRRRYIDPERARIRRLDRG